MVSTRSPLTRMRLWNLADLCYQEMLKGGGGGGGKNLTPPTSNAVVFLGVCGEGIIPTRRDLVLLARRVPLCSAAFVFNHMEW